MSEIKHISAGIKITENKSAQETRKTPENEAQFNDELKKSIDKMERMGTAIDIASNNLVNVQNNITNIKSTLHDVESWIDQIQGVIKNISETDDPSKPIQAKQAYDRAAKTGTKPNPTDENV